MAPVSKSRRHGGELNCWKKVSLDPPAKGHCELDGHLGNVQISKPDLDGAARHRIADCILADLFEVAMEISRRINRGASLGAAADGAGLLHPRRHRSP